MGGECKFLVHGGTIAFDGFYSDGHFWAPLDHLPFRDSRRTSVQSARVGCVCQRGLVPELLDFSIAEPMGPWVGTYLCFVFHPYDMTANKGIYPIAF